MTTLADVNATLGLTNIALSKVASNQEETTKGIQGFLDYLEGKDRVERREELEDEREEIKKASVLQRLGGGAAAVGGGLATAGKSALGFGKGLFSKLAIPAGLVGGFLTSLLSSKLLRGGLAGLGLLFGDQIAEYLLGPDAKAETKKVFGNAIKGASVGGFLFGKKGFIIGGALTALLQNKTVDQELGRLVDNIDKFAKKIGFDGLLGVLKKIGDAVGTGLKGLNDLAEGKVNFDSIKNTLGLLAGAAFLISPKGSILLLSRALGVLLTNPAGLALLAVAAGGAFLNKTMGNEISDAEGFLAALGVGTAGFLAYGAGKSVMDLGGVPTEGKEFKKDGKGKVRKLSKGSLPNASARNPLSRMLSTMVRGVAGGVARMGLFTLGAATVMLPLAAIGLTEKYFGDQFREATDKRVSDIKATKLLGGDRLTGFEDFSGVDLGKSMLQPEGKSKSLAAYGSLPERAEKELYDLQRLMIKKGTNDLENFFKMQLERSNETVPPSVGPSLVNSGNTNTTTTNNVGNTVLDTGSAFDFKSFKQDKAGIL